MPAAEAVSRPTSSGRALRLWLGFIVIIAAAITLAWFGAGALRPEISSSGLQFRVVKAGKGAPIAPEDAALLDYAGQLDDGTVFDSSEAHGGAQPFAMDGVFPGFGEAMAKMQEGGVYHFTMPKSLAFGDRPMPQGFTGNNLTFDVQVRKIVRGGSAMLQAQQAQQQRAPQQPPQ
jgi:FKBP-type peptidyl-prolyl cis-trans isomerase FkpA